MTEHVYEWLNAYLDGELGSGACTRWNSTLTAVGLPGGTGGPAQAFEPAPADSSAGQFTPPARFTPTTVAPAAQAAGPRTGGKPGESALAGPRRPDVDLGSSSNGYSGQGAGLHCCPRRAAAVLEAVLFGARPVSSLLFGAPLELFWGTRLGEENLARALNLLDEVSVLVSNFVTGLLWQAEISLLYIGWLVLWFVREQRQRWEPAAA